MNAMNFDLRSPTDGIPCVDISLLSIDLPPILEEANQVAKQLISRPEMWHGSGGGRILFGIKQTKASDNSFCRSECLKVIPTSELCAQYVHLFVLLPEGFLVQFVPWISEVTLIPEQVKSL